ncbi:cation transporter [Morganella morganii]|uniref:cation diffusion facilitator family transporter n=1 Tax=Morganella morganii TaxID=582 RepID=UPI000D1FD46F|nr:cation diffusion facilitator family transporter [Morganella morganii]HAE77318.1 cation transporter [Morganella sp. (in: enterobacteria)]QXO41815.1 cation transporter [Morganella morganii]QXO49099.1 cation transporter [Morganella morganii]QXO52938.1 cation transporter [Morganella morganii]QXO56794.1 cation transporter [Morganella morganii]
MSEKHEHGNIKSLPESRLLIAFALTFSFMLVEFIGGYLTGSLALISDAMHMMTDAFALLLALIAIRAGKKAADYLKTYGYVRFEILAAMMNALILLAVAFYVLYEAYRRISATPDIQSVGMLIIATAGLIINLIAMQLLKNSKEESLNVKGAYLEVWADMLGSVGVIVGAVIIWLTGWLIVDSVIAVFIGFMVFPRTWILLKSCINILLQGTPENISINDIINEINSNEDIAGAHNVHLWALTQSNYVLTAHIIYKAGADHNKIRKSLTDTIHEKYDIDNITFQMEQEKPE